MNVVVTGFCFLLALLWTLTRGAGAGLVFVYLPALTLLAGVSGFELVGLPDPTPPTAAVYGILAGAVLRGRPARLRFVLADGLLAVLLLAYVVSAVTTEFLYTGVSIFGSLLLQLFAPYYTARVTLDRRSTQRDALRVLVACALVVGVFALIEARLWPNAYAGILSQIGVRAGYVDFADSRFGLFRAASSFFHPIDLGASAALMAVLIVFFAVRTNTSLRSALVSAGLAACALSCFVSFSFTAYLGVAAGLGLFLLLTFFPPARRFLAPAMAAAVAIGFVFAATLANAPLGEREAPAGTFAGSLWIRHLIIQQAWQTAAGAGLFGWGRLVQVGSLESIDNAYLVIGIQRGWVALALWLALPVVLGALASRALRRSRSRTATRALLVAFCGTFGTMVAMFTVWLGFAYQSLFMIVVALTVNGAQAAAQAVRRKARATSALPAPPLASSA